MCRAMDEQKLGDRSLLGEDAAVFELEKQSLNSWALFVALLSIVMGALYLVRRK